MNDVFFYLSFFVGLLNHMLYIIYNNFNHKLIPTNFPKGSFRPSPGIIEIEAIKDPLQSGQEGL